MSWVCAGTRRLALELFSFSPSLPISPETNGLHQRVPEELVKEAEAFAQAKLAEDSDED